VRDFAEKGFIGNQVVVPVGGYEGKLQLVVCRLPERPSSDPTAYLGGTLSLPYTQKEYRKFGDAVAEKVGQCRPREINVIVALVSSDTHETADLVGACANPNQLLDKRDDSFFRKKGFDGAPDFKERFRSLSAIVFRNRWWSSVSNKPRNYVWHNPAAALALPAQIESHLSSMNGEAT
jgi:hypothetical protein